MAGDRILTIEYKDSKRIVGTNADRIGVTAVSGGWKELGRISGSRTINNSLTVSSLADKRYYMILGESQGGATYTNDIRLNADSGSNYAIRQSVNGGTDGAYTSQNNMNFDGTGSDTDKFGVGYIANLSTKEKLYQSHVVQRGSAGASNDPKRGEFAGKWSNTSNAINSISMLNRGSGTSSAGELVVLGWDPADTHTTNFWEELASVDWSSGTAIASGTFTAKKYLWIQGWIKSGTAGMNALFTFNSDTASNYNNRKASNGGGDSTGARANLDCGGSAGTANSEFVNMFIVNNSSNEKLCIWHSVDQSTAGAGAAPTRKEGVGKWNNTTAQITSINIDGNATLTDGTLKVWGAD